MRVQVYTTASAFRELQTEWLGLLARVPFQSVFFTPQWQEEWWRHFGAGRQLYLLTVRSEDGVLQGLAPLMISDESTTPARVELVGDLDLCDYLDMLIAPAYQREVGQACVSALLAEIGEETELCLANLTPRSLTPAALREALTAHGRHVEMTAIETCPAVPLAADWDAYLETLRGKDRHELRRKLRRAASAAHLECVVADDPAQLDDHLAQFFTLHRMSRQNDKQGFMTEQKAVFFRAMFHRLWSEGWGELPLLYADGVAVAGLCCFTYGTTYAAYNSGFHPDYAHLSVGIVLFADRIRSAMARRFTCFDFLRGNEPYKYRFGATDRPLYQFLARTPCAVPEACQ
jgi:CelD/BcsL family acetyltransferase involved in cellulose biosynthesis